MDKKHDKGRRGGRNAYDPPKGRFVPHTGDYVPNEPSPTESDSLLFMKTPDAQAKYSAPEGASASFIGEWDQIVGTRRVLTEADLDQLIADRSNVKRNDWLKFNESEEYPAGAILDEFKNMGITEMGFLEMSEKDRRKVSDKIRRVLQRKMATLRAEKEELQAEDKVLSIKERICEILMKPLVMEKPQGSSMHHFLQYVYERDVDKIGNQEFRNMLSEEFQLFVVEHDWAKAFGGSGDFGEGEIQMPFDFTCFELRISGMRVLLMVGIENGERKVFLAVGVNGNWTGSRCSMDIDGTVRLVEQTDYYEPDAWRQFLTLLRAQIRAVCIMLDAEVAETDLRRAPEKLNRQRERQGRTPLRDYHVVRLAHRHRVRAAEMRAQDEPGTRKRLHFRRGHDRHYPNYKVWIKWQLVGDPDLGFVDKEYRL